MGKENREVKSSVLVDLMYEDESAEENERSFYNALHETASRKCCIYEF